MPLAHDDLATLGVLGFSAGQEELYRLLLRNSGASVPDLAALAGLTTDDLRERVALLAGTGVVDVLDDIVTARPPAEAIARLVSEEAAACGGHRAARGGAGPAALVVGRARVRDAAEGTRGSRSTG